jgi:hypothetical protein
MPEGGGINVGGNGKDNLQTLENTEADTHFLVFERKTYLAARILCIFIVGQHLFSFLCDALLCMY